MPGTVEELEAAIQDNISEANSILFLNQNILEEYENRQHKVNECVLHKKILNILLDFCLCLTDRSHRS